MLAAPVAESRAILLTGTGLSRQPSRDATLFAAARAHSCGTKVILDLDFRPELWPDIRTFGIAFRSIIPLVNVVIGTTQEVRSAILSGRAGVTDMHITDGDTGGPAADVIEAALAAGPDALVIKRGAANTFVYARGGEVIEVPTFAVEVLNVLGAGDAFAAGFLYGYLKGWDLRRSALMGNACGAIVVTRHGCANFMPYEQEALRFIEERGGF